MNGRIIALIGADAPDEGQRCTRKNGKRWRCDQSAADALKRHIGAQEVTCTLNGSRERHREVAECCVEIEDLARWIVSSGWAVATSAAYVGDEAEAKASKLGIW